MLQFSLGFLLAVLSFHINHRIKRMVDVKMLINTLFEVYGNVDALTEYDNKDVSSQLMTEILNVEKMHDNNPYVRIQIKKLKSLRLLFFNGSETFEKDLKKINFKRLGRTFLILSSLNLNPDFLIIKNK
jgi:L-ribulose-5-phosphate 3-epimerase UlaE